MTTHEMDLRGLDCPQPTLEIGVKASELDDGEVIVAEADCSTFPDDVRDWCEKTDSTLISLVEPEPGVYEAEIQL
ncbi:sulfurtransferase TusA family protein [Natronobacterium gregoryi]|uniref:Redox protein, regulator of disulfide bond formation n=2 Tax=Natronobacterium gregoryi TaxID=44930 RepID=L0ALR6_NATGS|nr:sulfurtransferase TusA family protein [Natronobacterium gregoryi]AFZ74000.1 putative redox protein, regulator of disulfide bond formation [Natronobacterium gregoryi SP2]ELY70572.1 hypothetical protein C490_06344 [Natronobacterium gregoryi SP2]PLK20749.1 sulfurtransferase TusA family protein [Natronobacterium gregoryi SP2]SFJ08071.1 TusA-related sulfurtransferase [Natronobacterium gregoryi]